METALSRYFLLFFFVHIFLMTSTQTIAENLYFYKVFFSCSAENRVIMYRCYISYLLPPNTDLFMFLQVQMRLVLRVWYLNALCHNCLLFYIVLNIFAIKSAYRGRCTYSK